MVGVDVPKPRIAITPRGSGGYLGDAQAMGAAIREGGGIVVDEQEAEGLVWTDWSSASELHERLDRAPGIRWVQLISAGVDGLLPPDGDGRVWTSAKGLYAEPIAEYVLGGLLSVFREFPRFARLRTWSRPAGRGLFGARVVVVGGGGIAQSVLRVLQPFRTSNVVVRRHPEPMEHAGSVVTGAALGEAVDGADAVVLALALTPETVGLVNREVLARMGPDTWIVNVARGSHVVTADLVTALRSGSIGGAVLDVTDPEPLPDEHPLWGIERCIVTPHTACTAQMARPRLLARIRENVRRFATDAPLEGLVDLARGY